MGRSPTQLILDIVSSMQCTLEAVGGTLVGRNGHKEAETPVPPPAYPTWRRLWEGAAFCPISL